MAQREKPGKKHKLMFIPHSINRIWRNLLLLDIVLFVLWWFAPYGDVFFGPDWDNYVYLYPGIVVLILMLFFLLIRNWGSIQARPTHVLITIPFFRLKVPYDIINHVRMTEFRSLFTYRDLNWADKRFLRPYFKGTVATLHLRKYPGLSGVLRLFTPYLFLPDEPGFLFLIRDFVGFNNEVDSRMGVQKSAVPQREEAYGILNLFED